MRWIAKVGTCLGALACAASIPLSTASSDVADAATTSKSMILVVEDDEFMNYDYLSKSASGTNVDWPVTVLFIGNANIDRSKSYMDSWSNQFEYTSNQSMYLYMKDRFTDPMTWDVDNGKKTPLCPAPGQSSPHYRMYGIGSAERLYNPYFGFWVMATTHRDYNECATGKRHAQSEQTEDLLINEVDENTTVQRDLYDFANKEPLRDEGNHRWENNGLVSTVKIP